MYKNLKTYVENRKEDAKKKGGGKSFDQEKFSLEEDESAIIRCAPMEEPWLRRYHWPKGKGPMSCTAEHPLFDGRCVPCHYHQVHQEEQKLLKQANSDHKWVSSPLGQRKESIVEVIDTRYFHKLPNPDSKTNYDKFIFARCGEDEPTARLPASPRCEYCIDANPEISTRTMGGKKEFALRDNERELYALGDLHNELSNTCCAVEPSGGLCQGKGLIERLVCLPCDADLVPSREVRTLKGKALGVVTSKKYECPSCGTVAAPTEIRVCSNSRKFEHEFLPGSISNQCIEVRCTGVMKAGINGGDDYFEKTYRFKAVSEPRLLEDDLIDHGYDEASAEKLMKPWDFGYRYRPEYVDRSKFVKDGVLDQEAYTNEVLNKQAEKLGKPNPWATAPSGNGFGQTGGARSFRK